MFPFYKGEQLCYLKEISFSVKLFWCIECYAFTSIFPQLSYETTQSQVHHQNFPPKHFSPRRCGPGLHPSQLEPCSDHLQSVNQHSVTSHRPVLQYLHGASHREAFQTQQIPVWQNGQTLYLEICNAWLCHGLSNRPKQCLSYWYYSYLKNQNRKEYCFKMGLI